MRAEYEPGTAAALMGALDDVRALSFSPLLGGASLADRQLLMVLPVDARFRAALDALAVHAAQQQMQQRGAAKRLLLQNKAPRLQIGLPAPLG